MLEYLILALLGGWLALALRACFRRKGGCGGCGGCHDCADCPKKRCPASGRPADTPSAPRDF